MPDKTKKAFGLIFKIASWLLILFTAFMMVFTIVTVSTVGKNDRNIFGYKFYIVLSDSMSLSEANKDMDVHFNAGDIVIIKNVEDKTSFSEGDIISFISANKESYGQTVTHMVRSVEKTDGKVIGYVTFGTNTGTNDEALVEPEFVLGKYSGKLPGVGNFFAFVKSPVGYFVCILIPFLLLILYNGVNVIRLFRSYKKEQKDLVDAEKAEIAADRERNEAMMKELLALKAELERKTAAMNADAGGTGNQPDNNKFPEDNGQA